MNPTGYNWFVAPTEFEWAAQGMILRFVGQGPVYVNKCAFDMSWDGGHCEPVRIEHFDCNNLKSLLTMDIPAGFFDYLNSQPDFYAAFYQKWHDCANQQDFCDPNVKTFLKRIRNDDTLRSFFYGPNKDSAQRQNFRVAINQCQCDLSRIPRPLGVRPVVCP